MIPARAGAGHLSFVTIQWSLVISDMTNAE